MSEEQPPKRFRIKDDTKYNPETLLYIDEVGPDYRCSKCNLFSYRLWRDTYVFLNHVDLLCAVCAEEQEADNIKLYANHHHPSEVVCTIGNLVPARPTPEGDTFWGHTSGDIAWWYRLPQYVDQVREIALMLRERLKFLQEAESIGKDWYELYIKHGEMMRRLYNGRKERRTG